MSHPNIFHTEYPTEPISDFNQWQEYLYNQQGEKQELQRYKREIELSFDNLHRSITTQWIGNNRKQ
jgi:hypothetical protein